MLSPHDVEVQQAQLSPLRRLEQLDKFFVKQKITPMQNVYRISAPDANGNKAGEQLFHVKQHRWKVKEQIDFWEGDQSQAGSILAMRLKSRSAFEFRNRSQLELPDGTPIAQLQKDFGKSLLRSQWSLLDASGEKLMAQAKESSAVMAVLRRVWGFIPYIGDYPYLIPYHFDIMVGKEKVGEYKRKYDSLADSYVMDLSKDTNHLVDRTAAAGLAIALDSLSDR